MEEGPITIAGALRDPTLFVEAASVGADWIEAGTGGARIAVVDSADGVTLGHVPSLDARQVRGAVAAAAPERLPAAPAGATSIINVAAEHPRTGRRTITAVAPIVGGGGGMPHRDGTDGAGADSAYLKNSPIEITESEAPVRILRYGLMPDTGGAGTHRGGMAQVLEFCATAPDVFVTACNRDRSVFQPWGVLGGEPGCAGSFTLNPGTPREHDLRNTDALRLGPGDVLRVISPGGGGRGDLFRRPPAAVLRDVQAGLVSQEAARIAYGVVLVEGTIDECATAHLRETRPERTAFAPGAARAEHEQRWNEAAYATMLRLLADIPPSRRPFAKSMMFDAVRNAALQREASAVIREAFAAWANRAAALASSS